MTRMIENNNLSVSPVNKINVPTIDISIEMGVGDSRESWFTASIPLDDNIKEHVRFRATDADKEIIASTVIGILSRWASKHD